MHVGPKLLCTTQKNTAATMRWIDYVSPAKLRCWLNERRALKEWDVLDERHRHITTSSVEVVTWLNLSPHPPWKHRADALQPPYHLPTRKATWLCQKDRIHGQEADQGVTVTTSPLLIIGMEEKSNLENGTRWEKKKSRATAAGVSTAIPPVCCSQFLLLLEYMQTNMYPPCAAELMLLKPAPEVVAW